MSVVIHVQVRSCFAVSFRHFEFCISSSQSGQQSKTIKEPHLGVLSRETLWAKRQKNYESEALGNPVCSKDKCLPLDIGIVYFI